MKGYGLHSKSNVLELGCGIGAMTNLISKTVKKGKIEAVDISPRSVEFARRRIKNKNITFSTHDIVNYEPNLDNFDFITMFDVMEHIPQNKLTELLDNIANCMDENTLLLVNIPNPEYIEYERKQNNEMLQIEDNPIHLDFIVNNLDSNNLDLLCLKKYSIWVKDDYIFYVIKKKKEFKEEYLYKSQTIIKKILVKLFRLKLKLFHSYP